MQGISRLFGTRRGASRKVAVVAANGFTGVLNPLTCEPMLSRIVAETYPPLELDGRQIWRLSELEAHICRAKGWPVPQRDPRRDPARVTYLNGTLLYHHLLQARYEPILVNDFEVDRHLLADALEHDLLAVAISTTFLPFREHLEPVVRFVRERRPEVPIVTGGPTVYLSRNLLLEPDPHYDHKTLQNLYLFHRPHDCGDFYVVERRGEKTLVALLDALRAGREPSRVANLGVQTGDGVRFTAIAPEQFDIADENIDWDRIPDEVLGHSVSLRASTGCPFACEFCNFHVYADRLLHRPIEALLAELDQLARRSQVKNISFVDDNFLIAHKHMEAFCRTVVEREYPFTWSSFIRADSIRRESIGLVADSGASLLMFGVESGDPDVLRNMRKKSDTAHVLEVVNGLGERGISTFSTVVVGFPGETARSVDNTIALFNSYRGSATSVHWHSPFLFVMLPRTRVERQREQYGLEGFMLDWRHDTMDAMEAARQLKRFMIETTGAYYPLSVEHPYAAELLGLSPATAVELIERVDACIKNQMIARESGDAARVARQGELLARVEEIFDPANR